MEAAGLIGVILGVGMIFGAGFYVGRKLAEDLLEGVAWFTHALWRGYGFRASVHEGWTAFVASFWA